MITHQEASQKADIGMALAADKADRDNPGWSEGALVALERYIAAHPDASFIAEQVREWAEDLELIEPPENAKAWGQVFRTAARRKVIERIGYAPARSSNLSPKCLWRAL